MMNIRNLSCAIASWIPYHLPQSFFWDNILDRGIQRGSLGKNVQKSSYLDNEFLEVAKPNQDSTYFPV
jgi:hypothetical protein